jgi:hypothetical protein
MHMATVQDGWRQASAVVHEAAVSVHSRRDQDSLIGNPILEMSVYAAEGESLLGHLTCCLEIVVCKTTIVKVIMLDANAVLLGKLLKGTLGFDGLLGCE